LRPAHGDMVATSRLVKLGKTVCVVAVEVTGSDGKLVAMGRLAVSPSNIAIGQEEQFSDLAPAAE